MPQVFRPGIWVLVLIVASQATSTPKPHAIYFGKWATVEWFPGGSTAAHTALTLKVRPLLLDGRIKEFTVGAAHDVTERLFVVQRAFRVNDGLPQESASLPHWQWQRGGWLLVDRSSGHIAPINLPEFDAVDSVATWYRDYAAYCGVSDDGGKVYAIVAQLSRRKPVLKKLLESEKKTETTVTEHSTEMLCPAPGWQRSPARVTFEPVTSAKQTFAIRGRAVDLITESDQEEEEATK